MGSHRLSPGYLEMRHDGRYVLPWEHKALVISTAREQLRGVRYDTMVGTGMSGAMVVPWLAGALRKSWALVRKPGESIHSSIPFVGTVGDRYIIVDDLISTGTTRDRIIEGVADGSQWYGEADEPVHVGTWLYAGTPEFRPTGA